MAARASGEAGCLDGLRVKAFGIRTSWLISQLVGTVRVMSGSP
jgi:hypothetical protein